MVRRGLLLFVTVVTAVACTPAAGLGTAGSGSATTLPAVTTTTVVASQQPEAWESQMLARINSERSAVGASPLAICNTLRTAAQNHSADQAAHNTMTHTGSDGSTLTTRANRAGYTGWIALGENVAYGYGTVDAVMTGWMNSPGHRANLLDTGFTHVGLGQAAGSGGALYWTQDFGRAGRC